MSSEKYNKQQIIIINKLRDYLGLILEDLDPKSPQYEETSRMHKAINGGFCHGFSVVHAFMHLPENSKLGMPTWWDEVLFWISQWDGRRDSLDALILFKNATAPKSLRGIFDLAINHIVYNQMDHIKSPDHPVLKHTRQTSSSKFFSGLLSNVSVDTQPKSEQEFGSSEIKKNELKDDKKSIKTNIATIGSSYNIAGHFSADSLISTLDDGVTKDHLSKNICLIQNTIHTCSLRFDKDKNLWFFHDPNYNSVHDSKVHKQEKSFTSTEELGKEIFSILGHTFTISAWNLMINGEAPKSLESDQQPFSYYVDNVLKDLTSYLQNGGMAILLGKEIPIASKLISRFLKESKTVPAEIINHRGPSYGETALILASFFDNTELMALLLEKNADVNIRNKNGYSAFSYAIIKNNEEYIKKLLPGNIKEHHYEDNGRTPLIDAVLYCKTDTIDLILSQEVDVNAKDHKGGTALMYAVNGHSLEKARLLIASYANVDLQANDGTSALMLAVQNDDEALVAALLKAGADPHLKNKKGEAAIDFAKKIGNISILVLLPTVEEQEEEEEEEPVPVLDQKLPPPSLIEVVKNKTKRAVELAVVNNPDSLLSRDPEGKTALIHAVIKADLEIIRVLVKSDQDPDKPLLLAEDKAGKTALFYAVNTGRKDIVDYLLDSGFPVTGEYGTQALQAAIQRCDQPITRSLLEKGAKLKQLNLDTTLILSTEEMVSPISMDELLQADEYPRIHQGRLALLTSLALEEKNHPVLRELLNLTIAMDDTQAAARIINALSASCSASEIQQILLSDIKKSPVALATGFERTEVVALLLEHIPVDSIINGKNQTILSLAAEYGYSDLLELALQKNANKNIPDGKGRSPLALAFENGHDDIVVQLLIPQFQDQKDVENTEGPSHTQLLEIFITENRPEIIDKLFHQAIITDNQPVAENILSAVNSIHMNSGIDQALLKNMLKKFTESAVSWGREEIILQLIGGTIDTPINDKNQSILSLAAECGHTEIVQMALSHGADVHMPDSKGRSPAILAQENGHEDIVQILGLSAQLEPAVLTQEDPEQEKITGKFSFADPCGITFLAPPAPAIQDSNHKTSGNIAEQTPTKVQPAIISFGPTSIVE